MDKKLTLSKNKKIAGVCAGVAEYFDIDPTVIRLAYLILVLLGSLGLWVYLICWIVMPSAE